jgi:hypothetical protein
MKDSQWRLEFVFGHTVHFTELVSCMEWGIAVSFAKPVNVYVLAGGCYAFIDGRIPRAVYEASDALSSPRRH